MKKLTFVIFLILSVTVVNCVELPEFNLTTPELVRYWGYPVETHTATTDDGYILTLHRIPRGKQQPFNETKQRPVFFLQHGMLDSSSCWVINLPEQNLGFMLADHGYDVWMGNTRGNTYSKNHTTLDVSKSEFWDFSINEMAEKDLPAMINLVLNKTSHKNRTSNIYYVGHSQGATIALGALSENEELRKNIKLFFALAPLTRMANLITPFKQVSDYQADFKWALEQLGIVNEFLPSSRFVKHLIINNKVCKSFPIVCVIPLWQIAGYDADNFNETRLPIYLNHMPAGTSVRNLMHYLQLIKVKHFQKYDYGSWYSNYLKYGSSTPPLYELKQSNVKTVVFSGTNDWLATPSDVAWTIQMLPDVAANYTIKGYNHFDFTWATTAGREVYQKIIKTADRFEQ